MGHHGSPACACSQTLVLAVDGLLNYLGSWLLRYLLN